MAAATVLQPAVMLFRFDSHRFLMLAVSYVVSQNNQTFFPVYVYLMIPCKDGVLQIMHFITAI